jgi:hypothetical protein
MGAFNKLKSNVRLRGLVKIILGAVVFVSFIAWGSHANVDDWTVYITPVFVFPVKYLFLIIAVVGAVFFIIGIVEVVSPKFWARGQNKTTTVTFPRKPIMTKTTKKKEKFKKKPSKVERFLERSKNIDWYHPE